jgi:phenylalanyl-tRNA synthetase beta chain
MLCSEAELGLSEEDDGLIELDNDTPLGISLATLLQNDGDTLLEIDNKSITNRSDLWGFEGIASELAALFNLPYTNFFNAQWQDSCYNLFDNLKHNTEIEFDLEEAPTALAYGGFCVSGVDNRKSPLWLKVALMSAGIRPINALVDISNYVMLELAIPTHFYDRDKLSGNKLFIRQLKNSQNFTTLDGKERLLQAGDTLISDEQKPLVLAGIMGGDAAKIEVDTHSIFVEAAVWQGEAIRKTSLRLGLRSDASLRFEKALDPMRVKRTLLRTAQLIAQIFPQAQFKGLLKCKIVQNFTPYSVKIDSDNFNRVMGLQLDAGTMQAILTRLGFITHIQGNSLISEVPSYRSTKEKWGERDIYEEIGRIYGYNHIKAVAPLWPLEAEDNPSFLTFERAVQDFWVLHAKCYELISHPMVGKKMLDEVAWPDKAGNLKLANALSPDFDRMRPALIPSLLKAIELNQKHSESFKFFEYGRTFTGDNLDDSDHYHLGVALFNRTTSPFIELCNLLESFFKALHLNAKLEKWPKNETNKLKDWQGIHPTECFAITCNGHTIGLVSTVHPYLMRNLKIKGLTTLAEIYLTPNRLQNDSQNYGYKALSKYPKSIFDCTVVLPVTSPAACLLTILEQANIPYFEQALLVTLFTLNNQQRAVTLRVYLGSNSHTLSANDIKTSENLIVQSLAIAGYPLKQ